MQEDGLHVKAELLVGKPSLRIIEHSIERRFDLVMIGASPSGHLRERLLQVVHSIEVERPTYGGDEPLPDPDLSNLEAEASARIDRLAEAAGIARPSDLLFPHGRASRTIPEIAESQGVGPIVMGTVARTGIRGLLVGNTAEAVMNAADCPILALKPIGFVSPVE